MGPHWHPGASGSIGWRDDHRQRRRARCAHPRPAPRRDYWTAFRLTGAGDNVVSSKPIRVLFADDHPIVRDGFAAMIAAERDMVSIGEVETGEEAIKLFRKLKP